MHDQSIPEFENYQIHCQTAFSFFEWLNKIIKKLNNGDYLRTVVLMKQDKYTVSWKKTSLFNDTPPWILFGFINPTVEELDSYSTFEIQDDDLPSSKGNESESNMNNDTELAENNPTSSLDKKKLVIKNSLHIQLLKYL
ncbi:MAG: hypothetical protein ACTSYA_12425 [Candidatus Kariarchaeaceae archaeon]